MESMTLGAPPLLWGFPLRKSACVCVFMYFSLLLIISPFGLQIKTPFFSNNHTPYGATRDKQNDNLFPFWFRFNEYFSARSSSLGHDFLSPFCFAAKIEKPTKHVVLPAKK